MHTDPSVLLLSHSNEPYCTEQVASALRARGAQPLRLNTDDFPSVLALSGDLDPHRGPHLLLGDEALIVDAVWLWRLWAPRLPEGMLPAHRSAATNESATTLRGLLDLLAPTPWIDPIDAVRAAENKTRQLRLAQSLGLTIPATLITADPAAALRFWRHHHGDIIAKLQTALAPSMTGGGGLPTRRIRAEDLDALAGLRGCPMILQKYVPKAMELRIAWVDGNALVGALDGALCGVDWRYESTASWQHHRLPEPVHTRLGALMRHLGLRQGAIDLIVTPDHDYVFLEVNPHGEWGMLARDLGLPIAEALAEALLRQARAAKD